MNFKTEKHGNTLTVKMGGPLTIEHAAELKNIMTNVSEKSEKIVVDLDDVTDLDLSCIQLLCSANLCFDDTRKRLIRKSVHSKVMTQALFEAGFTTEMVCHGLPCKKCFWKGEEK